MLIYLSNYSFGDCIRFMRNKNVYDVFEFRFEDTSQPNSFIITITGCNTHMCRNIRTRYFIKFVDVGNYTQIDFEFIDELWFLPLPCIPEKWIDEFMVQKLSANKVDNNKLFGEA